MNLFDGRLPRAWCCEQGQRLAVPVCPECAEISAAYQADMGPTAGSEPSCADGIPVVVRPQSSE